MSGIFSNIEPSTASQRQLAAMETCQTSYGGRLFPDTPDSAQNKKSGMLTQATIASPFSFYKASPPLKRVDECIQLTFGGTRKHLSDTSDYQHAPKIRPDLVWLPRSAGDQEDLPDISSVELEVFSKYLTQDEKSNFNSSIMKRVSSQTYKS